MKWRVLVGDPCTVGGHRYPRKRIFRDERKARYYARRAMRLGLAPVLEALVGRATSPA